MLLGGDDPVRAGHHLHRVPAVAQQPQKRFNSIELEALDHVDPLAQPPDEPERIDQELARLRYLGDGVQQPQDGHVQLAVGQRGPVESHHHVQDGGGAQHRKVAMCLQTLLQRAHHKHALHIVLDVVAVEQLQEVRYHAEVVHVLVDEVLYHRAVQLAQHVRQQLDRFGDEQHRQEGCARHVPVLVDVLVVAGRGRIHLDEPALHDGEQMEPRLGVVHHRQQESRVVRDRVQFRIRCVQFHQLTVRMERTELVHLDARSFVLLQQRQQVAIRIRQRRPIRTEQQWHVLRAYDELLHQQRHQLQQHVQPLVKATIVVAQPHRFDSKLETILAKRRPLTDLCDGLVGNLPKRIVVACRLRCPAVRSEHKLVQPLQLRFLLQQIVGGRNRTEQCLKALQQHSEPIAVDGLQRVGIASLNCRFHRHLDLPLERGVNLCEQRFALLFLDDRIGKDALPEGNIEQRVHQLFLRCVWPDQLQEGFTKLGTTAQQERCELYERFVDTPPIVEEHTHQRGRHECYAVGEQAEITVQCLLQLFQLDRFTGAFRLATLHVHTHQPTDGFLRKEIVLPAAVSHDQLLQRKTQLLVVVGALVATGNEHIRRQLRIVAQQRTTMALTKLEDGLQLLGHFIVELRRRFHRRHLHQLRHDLVRVQLGVARKVRKFTQQLHQLVHELGHVPAQRTILVPDDGKVLEDDRPLQKDALQQLANVPAGQHVRLEEMFQQQFTVFHRTNHNLGMGQIVEVAQHDGFEVFLKLLRPTGGTVEHVRKEIVRHGQLDLRIKQCRIRTGHRLRFVRFLLHSGEQSIQLGLLLLCAYHKRFVNQFVIDFLRCFRFVADLSGRIARLLRQIGYQFGHLLLRHVGHCLEPEFYLRAAITEQGRVAEQRQQLFGGIKARRFITPQICLHQQRQCGGEKGGVERYALRFQRNHHLDRFELVVEEVPLDHGILVRRLQNVPEGGNERGRLDVRPEGADAHQQDVHRLLERVLLALHRAVVAYRGHRAHNSIDAREHGNNLVDRFHLYPFAAELVQQRAALDRLQVLLAARHHDGEKLEIERDVLLARVQCRINVLEHRAWQRGLHDERRKCFSGNGFVQFCDQLVGFVQRQHALQHRADFFRV
uniref:Uncharacterized protein n=1 Tax=Anopheles melas TaxID=34690 RepID=A0A182TYF0_9DIPT